MSAKQYSPSLMEDDDEEARWAKFHPMREHYDNPLENCFMSDSVGGTMPKKYLTQNRRSSEPSKGVVKLYVSKIPLDVTERGLRNIFSPYGSVLCVSIVRNTKKDRSHSYNFGFVSYANIIEANRAIQGLNNTRPYFLHLEFEISEEEKRDRELIENFATTMHGMTSLDEPDESQLEADYSIKENISYSPGLPLENIALSSLPSFVDTLCPHHLYEQQQHCEELYEPYLVWDASAREEVANRIALRHYIAEDNTADIIHGVYNEPAAVDKTEGVTPEIKSPSVKSFGVKGGSRTIQSCVYCHRRVFNSTLLCRCGVVYDDVQCQLKHWPQHKPMCKPQANSNERTNSGANSYCDRDEDKDEFNKIIQGFKKFYASCGSILDRKALTNAGINIIPQLWWDSNSGLVVVTNEVLVTSLCKMLDYMKTLPDADDSQVEIGQLVGVFLDHMELYVRGIVAVKTRLGLIGVLLLEHGSFVFVPSVKVVPALTSGSDPACNVQCSVISRDRNFVMQNNRNYRRVKDSNKYRAFAEDYNSCTVELSPYLPSPEQIPLLCITLENKTRVILTTFYSTRALYIQPVDLDTQIRCTVISSEVNNWCINNHIPAQWTPKKNQLVGVKRPDGEYRRGQVIGTVTCNKEDCSESVEKKHYLVSLMDSGRNVKVSCDNLVALPNQFKNDPCYCTKVSLKDSNRALNPECCLYLNLLVENKTPLIVNFVAAEFMTVELTDESGNSVSQHIESLTALPWQISPQEVNPDPTKTEAVLTLHTFKVPLYPLSSGDKVQLKLLNVYDVSYASMLVMSREENEHVQNVLGPCMKQYCAHLTMDKYNPRNGGYCLVYCRDLSMWCRALCEKSSDEHGHCFVFLVDYGVHAHIPISDIRPCHALFTKFHSMAFVAHIPEFGKTELSSEELMEKYSTHEFTVVHVIDCSEQNTSDRVVLAI